MITINGKRATPNEAAKTALREVLLGLASNIEAPAGGTITHPNHGREVQREVWDIVDNPAAMTQLAAARVEEQWGKKIEAMIKRLGAERLAHPGYMPED